MKISVNSTAVGVLIIVTVGIFVAVGVRLTVGAVAAVCVGS